MDYDHDRFVGQVRNRTGLDDNQARVAVTTTLEAIGRAVEPGMLDRVADLLPEALAEPVRRGAKTPSEAEDFLADIAAHEHVRLGFAREHAQVVCETLAGILDEGTRELLERRLPEEIAAWLVPYVPAEERRVQPAARWEGTLASGRPGSQNPLSEAGPDHGQRDSLAATSDPHADTRLSSARGVSTERSGRTIADGRPGSSHPVSEGHDRGD